MIPDLPIEPPGLCDYERESEILEELADLMHDERMYERLIENGKN